MAYGVEKDSAIDALALQSIKIDRLTNRAIAELVLTDGFTEDKAKYEAVLLELTQSVNRITEILENGR